MADTATETVTITEPTTTAPPDTGTEAFAAIKALCDDMGLDPGQIKGRLEASRKWEERAKSNTTAAKELEQLRQQSMTDIEKAVEQARAEGRTEATKAAASRTAAAEIRAAAAGRLDTGQVTTLLDGLNLAAFVDDDGDVDQAKVAKFVEGIAPKPTEESGPAWPDLGQGARGSAGTGSADPLLEAVKRLGGSR